MLSFPIRLAFVLSLFLLGSAVTAQGPWTLGFDEDLAEQPPRNFTLAAMRQTDVGRWLVQRTGNGGGHLVHRADPAAPGFALAVADRRAPTDLALSARLRFSGSSRVGGLVWRYSNDQNYYCLLLDLNRGALSVYRITAGTRVQLDIQDELELDPSAWHTLKVVHVGADIKVMLGGVRVFDEEDRRSERREASGRVGFIATGASEIWFDDLHVNVPDPKRSHR